MIMKVVNKKYKLINLVKVHGRLKLIVN